MPFRFVHTADIHLDSPLRSLAMRDPELSDLIAGSTRQALIAIVDLCLDERVDALVIAGDLYDGDQTSMKTARFLAGQLGRLHDAGIQVFKVRGNHDALSKITKELILPPTLTLFGGRAETVEVQAGNLPIVVHGLSFARPHAPESLLAKYARPSAGAVNIGVMHTSLDGSPHHDPYAPCSVSDLHGWGFDYWALGHIHSRAVHAGASTVVMPGMPQGRDIGESGPKSVTLVSVGDDHAVCVEERATSFAQFEVVAVDLAGTESWSEAMDRIENGLTAAKTGIRAPHLVARLALHGETALAWRLRHDRDLLRTEVEHRLGHRSGIWLDKTEISTRRLPSQPTAGSADPLVELGVLIGNDLRRDPSVRAAVSELVKELRDDLPPDARSIFGNDEVAFESFIETLLDESGEEIVARLSESGASHR